MAAISSLLEIEHDDAIEARATKYFRFFQFLKSALLFSTDTELTGAAAKTLNRVLELGGNFGDAFMQQEVPRLLELLKNKDDFNRYGSVLILRAFARHFSHQFSAFVDLVLEWIWTPLRDSRSFIREAGADLLASCFDVMGGRMGTSGGIDGGGIGAGMGIGGVGEGAGGGVGSSLGNGNLSTSMTPARILREAIAGLRSTAVDHIHGSLLAYRVILLHSASVRSFPSRLSSLHFPF